MVDVKFNKEARKSIREGIKIVADSVGSTLGPKGKFVIIGEYNKSPRVTKDGVSVAKAIELPNQFQNIGAQLIKEAAIKTLNTVGDATTTSTVLADSMISNADLAIECKRNPTLLKKGVEKAINEVIKFIEEHAIPVADEDLIKIATISANNDAELGKLIADTYKEVGKNGVITVEESSNVNTYSKIIKGMQFDRGYLAPHFVTNTIKDECVLNNPYILITDQKIHNLTEIRNILNPIVDQHASILIIAEDIEDEALENLKYNKLQGILQCCAIKCPSFGEYRKEVLEDIAILTNGTNVSYDSSIEVQDIKLEHLGKAEKVIINKNETLIIGGIGDESKIKYRIDELSSQLKRVEESPEMDGSFMIDFLKQRIAKLDQGISIIYAGGITELEMQERKDRIEDAICATKAAIEGGIVPGGGLIYLNAAEAINDLEDPNDSINDGITIVIKALQAPISRILSNIGYNSTEISTIISQTSNEIGFDANIEKFVNMVDSGIVDPAKASILALKNAASIAELYLNLSCVIVPHYEENN